MNTLEVLEGSPKKLGAYPTDEGVNFAVYSKTAERVVLDLFDSPDSKQPTVSLELNPAVNKTGSVWHIFVKGLKAGSLYLYRVDGPYNPPAGHRFNFNKYLLDPYAKAFSKGSIFRSYNLQRERGLAGIENGKLSDLSFFVNSEDFLYCFITLGRKIRINITVKMHHLFYRICRKVEF